MSTTVSPARLQEHLDPARTGHNILPRIPRAPALREADLHRIGVDGSIAPPARKVPSVVRQRRLGRIEHADAVLGRYFGRRRRRRRRDARVLQRQRVHKHRMLAAIIHPDSVLFS